MPTTTMDKARHAAWVNPNSFATTLLLLFFDEYGEEGFDWDPRTILYHIENDLNVNIPAPNFDRLMTAITLCTTDLFYTSCPHFIQMCNILSGDAFDPRVWDPADAGECAWGITEGMLIWPPDAGDENPFSPEIAAYIGQVLDWEGIIHPPDVLQIGKDRATGMLPDTYTDDPTMFTAISEFEDKKTSAISQMLRENLRKLSEQLQTLPLRTGDAAESVQRTLAAIRQ